MGNFRESIMDVTRSALFMRSNRAPDGTTTTETETKPGRAELSSSPLPTEQESAAHQQAVAT